MVNPNNPGIPPVKKTIASFFFLLILIGSTISSALLWGLTIFPQQAWAAAPSQVLLTSPTDGITTSDNTPTLSWNRITGSNAATSYNIQIDNDGTGFPSPTTSSVPQPGSGGTVSFTPSTLALGTYAWRVQGVNADGAGTFSTPRTFIVALAAPTLVSPADSATSTDQTPTFTWNRVTGATSYKIEISTSNSGTNNCDPSTTSGSGFNTNILTQTVSDPGSGTVTFTPSADLADGNKFWHVKSISGSIEGCYSGSRSVNIDDNTAPAAPT